MTSRAEGDRSACHIPHHDARAIALVDLGWAVLDVFVQMKAVSDRLTREEGQTTSRLSVLREIAVRGPVTVAQIARTRRAARQGVQRLANELERDGLLEFAPNPQHRRSPLLHLTPAGRRVTKRLLARQDALARALGPYFSAADVRRATDLLGQLAERLQTASSAVAQPLRRQRAAKEHQSL